MTGSGTDPEANHVVLAFGGSAGSVQPLIEIIGDLPDDLPAPVLVTIHVGEQTRLPQILSRSGPLQASHGRDGEELQRGRIYVAPPGRHLIVRDGHAKLSTGPLVNRHRPAVDVMFASAADWVDGHTVAVVLSGALDDGAVGVALVDLAGGQVLVQDPVEAEFGGMPQAALAAAPRSRAFSASRLALEIRHCLGRAKSRPSHRKAYEARMEADMDMLASDNPAFLRENESQLTRLTCPECGGAMAQVDLPKISYFRCHVGHQFGPQALAAAQLEASERRLWSAVAALEEQAAVLHHVQRHAPREQKSISSDQDQNAAISARYADEVASRAAALRDQVRAWSSNPPELDATAG